MVLQPKAREAGPWTGWHALGPVAQIRLIRRIRRPSHGKTMGKPWENGGLMGFNGIIYG